MKEDLLHHVWKTKNFDFDELLTTDNEKIQIHQFGTHNFNSGPDFLDARITIGDTLWAGHVEIHINSSDWNAHKHQNDNAYNNVILHVVYADDKPILNSNGQSIPTLVLKPRIKERYLNDYDKLTSSLTWVPCANHLEKINKDKIPFFLERLVVQRLSRKRNEIDTLLDLTKNNWEEVLYRLILKYLGLKVNGVAFDKLATIVPHSLLVKQESILQKESLLFGQAGFINNQDEYFKNLSKEFQHQKAKYQLTPLTGVEWHFSRLRPANFPTIRIAQIAALVHKTPQLFNELINDLNIDKLKDIFDIEIDGYWNTHYIPGKESAKRKKSIGNSTREILIINAIVPLVFSYSVKTDNEQLKNKALDLLNKIKPEKNKIIRAWNKLGLNADSASQSQALIELKNNNCDTYNCLNCQIGQQIIFA